MRSMLRGILAVSILLAATQTVLAKCGDNAGDEQAVIDARAAAASQCDCTTATNHGQYVKCVAGVAKMRSSGTNPSLPKNCTGAVKKCAAHSTCCKSGEVTCCFASTKGPKCKIKKSATDCTTKGGTPAVDPTNTSCCSTTHPLTDNACMASPSGAFLDGAAAY